MTTQQEEDSRTTQPPTTLPPQPSSLPPTLEEYGSPPLLPPPIDAPLPYSQPAPLELPRSNPDIQRKLFEAYRARLRRSYLMPLLMWLPSFAFVLYFAIQGQINGSAVYSWGAVLLWIVMLIFIARAYRSRFKRLSKVYSLGLLESLPLDELNDVVMNGAPLRPAPTYDETAPRFDEPLPPYPLRRTNSTRSGRSMRSLRRWLGSNANEEEQNVVPMTSVRVDGDRTESGTVLESERESGEPGAKMGEDINEIPQGQIGPSDSSSTPPASTAPAALT